MERDDIELIQSVLSGDDAAFSELVQKYQKSVHALAWRKIGDFHIAEEITQDTFLQAHKKLASLKNPSQFAGWLYVITDRLCKAWFRKKKLWTQSLEATSVETLEKAAYADYVCEQREETAVECRREIVQKLMEKLPESERTVMVLHYLGEMSCEAISKFLGVSPNTVKSRLKRARERLQNEEHIIRETLGSVPLRPDLTENIMRRIDTIKQTSPSGGKPLLPFAALGASAILVILLMGASKQFNANFQQPYSVDAQSEPTIEIVDAPVVLNIQSKPEWQNRVGGDTNLNENSNNGLTKGTKTVENNFAQEAMQWNLPEDAKARFGKGCIRDIQYSPDGKFLAVASGIGIWLYDVTVHQEASLITGHTSVVDCLAFSSDGRILVSGNVDGTIVLYDRIAGTQKTLIGHNGEYIKWIALSPDGKILASSNPEGTIRLWDAITGEAKYTLMHDAGHNFTFTPDSGTIVVVSNKDGISLWNSDTGEQKKTFDLHPDCAAIGAASSPDGETLAIGSDNGAIYLHDLNTGELKMTLSKQRNDVDYLTFSPDGNTIATSSGYVATSLRYDETTRLYLYDETTRLYLWDVHTGAHRIILTEHARWVRGLAFSPDGKTIASGDCDGTIRFWDIHTGNPKNTFTGHSEELYSVALNQNGDIIASGCNTGIIRLWDADTRQLIKTLNGSKNGHIAFVRSTVFSPDGKTLFCGADDGIHLWNIRTGEHKRMLTGHTDVVNTIALSSDGNILASGSWDNTIRLWDAHTGEHKKTLTGHTDSVATIAFSPDGKTLASGGMENNTIRLWDVVTGKNKMTLIGHTDPVEAVAFSPDGKTIASGSLDNTIRLWDVDTGKTKMILTGHTDWVYSLAFSPDGKTIASGCIDATIHLWDIDTGENKKILIGHTSHVKGVVFSPDGKTLVSGSRDGSVLLWEINP
ncbi:MAG: sigma-70 family RNA polymerase sigma factor [Candidatus Poribacteria bacterium]|nr:sigma-70 family RNA polymerase sigma factor [Candidatus Poribacteria bacterium]